MNLSLLADADTPLIIFEVPVWVLWGIGGGLALTLAVFVISWLVMKGSNGLTMGWLDGNMDMSFGSFVKAFATYGLLPSLACSWLWASGHPVWGVVLGLVVLVVVGVAWARVESNQRRRRYRH